MADGVAHDSCPIGFRLGRMVGRTAATLRDPKRLVTLHRGRAAFALPPIADIRQPGLPFRLVPTTDIAATKADMKVLLSACPLRAFGNNIDTAGQQARSPAVPHPQTTKRRLGRILQTLSPDAL